MTRALPLFFLLFFAVSLHAEIIPTDRRITWTGYIGVKGGITNRATVFASVKDAPYNAVGNGVNDDTAEIQAALDAGTADQVITLPAGTYKITAPLILKRGYTFRGAGTNSILMATNQTGNSVIQYGTETNYEFPWYPSPANETSVTAGYEKGSTTITVSSTTGFTVGQHFQIDCTTNIYANGIGGEGLGGWNGRGEALRVQKQICEITGISGSDVTFTPPLYLTYSNSLSPKAIPFSMNIQYAGVEDMKISVMNDGSSTRNFQMYGAANCWIKNVESDYADGDHIHAANCFRCEVRDSYFHDGYSHGPGTEDDCLKLTSGCSAWLIEDNIIRRQHVGIMFWGGGGGHVIGYNYFTNGFSSGCPTCLAVDISYHGGHPTMMLFEGNVMNSFNADGVWGTASHGTLHRGVFTGLNYVNGPLTGRSAEDSSWTKQIAGVWAVNLSGFGRSTYFNLVGNSLGATGMGNYPSFDPGYVFVRPDFREWDHEGHVITLGYVAGNDTGSDGRGNTDPSTTILNHGNWNVVSNAVIWDAGIADHTFLDSYYLTAKPSFFGTNPWPYNPTNSVALLPAVYRWLNGTNPPPESGGGGGSSHNGKRSPTQSATASRRR